MTLCPKHALAGCLVALAAMSATPAAAADVIAVRIDVRGPLHDPEADFWQLLPATTVAMYPQNIAVPYHLAPAVDEITVRVAHNSAWIGVMIEWHDDTADWIFTTDSYGDQVAVQLPITLDPLPAPMMGDADNAVNILQWRAAFQRDLEEGDIDILDLYPDALVDVYPDQVMAVVDTWAYAGAIGVDNPVARPDISPVLDMVAKGYGSTTVKGMQHADGRGVWEDGIWRVAITRPLEPMGTWDPDLVPPTETALAFAVWDGSANEVGARKSWSNWIFVELTE